MKNFIKVVLCTIATSYVCPTAFAYENGKSFDKLPQKMSLAKQATVGLSLSSGIISTSNCTGVMLNKNTIVTAAHCFDSNKPVDLTIYTSDGKSSNLKKTDYTLSIPKKFFSTKKDTISTDGTDIAVIRARSNITTKDFYPIYNSMVISTQSNYKPGLNDILFNGKAFVFGLGWGSKSAFNFASQQLCNLGTLSRNCVSYFPISMNDIDKDINIDNNLNKVATFSKSLITPVINEPGWSEQQGTTISNTNYFLIKNPSNYSSPLTAEQGDSGGPVFTCRNEQCTGKNDPLLIGILAAGTGDLNGVVSYTNPYAIDLISGIN